MLEKLKLVEARYLEMAERAAQPDFYNDPKAASQLLKEQRQLEPIITAYRSYIKTTQEQEDLRAMLSDGLDPDMKALCQEEFSANKKKLEELEQELKILLLPRDPNDDKSVIMEIRGGVAGEESALFAHSLYQMYTMYAPRPARPGDRVRRQSPHVDRDGRGAPRNGAGRGRYPTRGH